MSFNDDEQIVKPQDDSSVGKPPAFVAGKTQVTVINKPEAPLEKTKFKVLLEITGSGDNKDRPGVDLVTVIDVSGSMRNGGKLDKLKIAMQFLIKKLSSIDRLSVIIFADSSKRLFQLRQITEDSQAQIIGEVNALVANGNTNIADGLRTALKVLEDRRTKDGRVGAIMLMSDGAENRGKAAGLDVSKVPVYTFGFGADHDPTVLQAVANKSNGGTFSDVQNQNNLSIAFSQCLAGLLTIVVKDLTLTVSPVDEESTIENVSAGNYPQTKNGDGSLTISFGDLYNKEVRKVIVDLLLPEVDSRRGSDVLEVTYTYSTGLVGKPPFEANPITATVTRTGSAAEREREEVIVEENRVKTAKVMKEAREMADAAKLEDAKRKLLDAQNSLEDVEIDKPSPLLEMLKSELQQLFDLMESPDIYRKKGRPFALSSESSHERQRFAARGDDVGETRLFATPRMDAYLEQAKAFDEDPTKPLPSVEDDVKEEIAADPLGPVIGSLRYYIQVAIQALKSVDIILGTASTRP